MPTRIESLTDAQRAAIPAHVERWIAAGLCTDPAARETAERSLRAMYAYAGFAPPEILWAANPPEMARLLAGCDTGPAVESAVVSAVGSAVVSAVWSAVGSAVWSAVESVVESAVGSAVWSAVGGAVGSAFRSAFRSAYDGGHTWVSWPAVESYYREACGLTLPGDLSERGKALADYRSSVGPGLWYKKVAILCERPLSFDPLTWRESSPDRGGE